MRYVLVLSLKPVLVLSLLVATGSCDKAKNTNTADAKPSLASSGKVERDDDVRGARGGVAPGTGGVDSDARTVDRASGPYRSPSGAISIDERLSRVVIARTLSDGSTVTKNEGDDQGWTGTWPVRRR